MSAPDRPRDETEEPNVSESTRRDERTMRALLIASLLALAVTCARYL